MKRRFEVIVALKEGLLDPQGKTIEESLPTMGWTNMSEVRVGRTITLVVDTDTERDAEEQIAEMATKSLTNPVIETFHVRELTEEPG